MGEIIGKLLNNNTITSGVVAAAASALITWGNLSATVEDLKNRTAKIEVKQDESTKQQESINEKLVAIDTSLGYIREYIVNMNAHSQGKLNANPEK